LTMIKTELDEAAKVQPCPGCKHDIEQLAKFVAAKADALQSGSKVDSTVSKALKDVDFVNELTDMAMFISKIVKPFGRSLKVPEVYEKVLHDDRKGNEDAKTHLVRADELLKELKLPDRQYTMIHEIVGSFIRATEFKLSIDPVTFYLFDKAVRLGYKTHLLSATGKVIVGIKVALNPSRYE
jgi:hypothetical protein